MRTLIISARRVQPLLGIIQRAELFNYNAHFICQHRSAAIKTLLTHQCHNLANNPQEIKQSQEELEQQENELDSCIENLKELSYKIVKKRPTQVFHVSFVLSYQTMLILLKSRNNINEQKN